MSEASHATSPLCRLKKGRHRIDDEFLASACLAVCRDPSVITDNHIQSPAPRRLTMLQAHPAPANSFRLTRTLGLARHHQPSTAVRVRRCRNSRLKTARLANGIAAAADLAAPTQHPIHGRTFATKNSISPQMQMMPATQDAHGVGERSAMQDWRVNRVQPHDYRPLGLSRKRRSAAYSGPHPAT
jgi:hypothetical protein